MTWLYAGIPLGVLLIALIAVAALEVAGHKGSGSGSTASIFGGNTVTVFQTITSQLAVASASGGSGAAPAAPPPVNFGQPAVKTTAQLAEDAAQNGDWTNAMAYARQALVVNPGDQQMQSVVAKALAQMKSVALDNARKFAAMGDWDKVNDQAAQLVVFGRDDKDVDGEVNDLFYQEAMSKSNAALAANDLDTALSAAELAVAHKPGDSAATDLLKKVRNEIMTSKQYLGKNLVPAFNLSVSHGPVMSIRPVPGGNLFIASDNRAIVCNPDTKQANELPDVSAIFVASTGTVRIISLRAQGCVDINGQVLWRATPRVQETALGISPDGQLMSVVMSNNFAIINSTSGEVTVQVPLQVHVAGFGENAREEAGGQFSPDGKFCAVRGADWSWNVVDVGTGQVVHSFPNGHVSSRAAFGADRYFAYAANDHVSVVDVTSWQEVANIGLQYGIANVAHSLEFTPDGKTLVVHARNGTTRIFIAATGDQIGKTLPDYGHIMSPDGQTLLFNDGRNLTAYRTSDSTSYGQISADNVQCMAYAPDGRLYLGYGNGSVSLLGPPKWSDDTSLRSLASRAIADPTRFFDDYSTNRAMETIAKIKQQYGLDIVVSAGNGLPDATARYDLVAGNNAGASTLKFTELLNGAPGYYILISRYPAKIVWGEVPPASGELLTADQLKSLGGRLDGLSSTDNAGQALNQFLRELTDDLQQDHPGTTTTVESPAAGNTAAAAPAPPAPAATAPPATPPVEPTPNVAAASPPPAPSLAPEPDSTTPSGAIPPSGAAPATPPAAPSNASYPPAESIKTNTVVIAPDGTFRVEEWIGHSPVNGNTMVDYRGWVVGNGGSAAMLPAAARADDPNTGNTGVVIFPSFYSISPDGKYIFRSRKVAAGLGGAYLYTRGQGVAYDLTEPDLALKTANFFALATTIRLSDYIVEFSRWLPDGRLGIKIRGATDHHDVGVQGWECLYDPASQKFGLDPVVMSSNAAAITHYPAQGTEQAGAAPAAPPPAPEQAEVPELVPPDVLQACVTEYSNGQVELNENFSNQYQNRVFRYTGVVGRHNNEEGLVVFKGGGMIPYNWDLQVKARLRDYPIGERAHIYIKLTAIKYYPFAGWSFRGNEVDP